MSVPRQGRLRHLKWLRSPSSSSLVSKVLEGVGDRNRQYTVLLPCEVPRLR